MTRPQIIRADTIDLQAHDAPSAQRHHKPSTDGSLAPHQAETLREVAAEAAEENLRSPRVSWSADPADPHQHAVTPDSATGRQENVAANNMRAGAQQDALAIAQNGGLSGHEADDGDPDGDAEVYMDDDMDKISSSPSIEDEDIDFDFVYALHTFVATVEGQANATKGDTMVLLDDSNSYWWLVRVVKDSSIGYLPAEHIETPTERLARLNKHRNIDLSASMLGDQAEKARNPIKSAMKRRKTKTVQFAAPTYVDYSDVDYSTGEEDVEAEYFAQQQQQGQQAQQSQQSQQSQQTATEPEVEDESAKVEPLRPRSQPNEAKTESKRQERGGETEASANSKAASRVAEEVTELKASDGPKKTSDGTVRDSFFKDDTVETKKITLTPNLLRDDNAPRVSSDSKEVKQRPSLDKLDKDGMLSKDDKKKKKEKEKDRKPGGLRGFFSRKDKKSKGDEEDDAVAKRSMEADAPEKDAEDDEAQPSAEKAAGPQRHPSKLQKQQPRTEPSPTRRSSSSSREPGDARGFLSEGTVNNVANIPPASMRLVDSSPKASPEGSPRDQRPSRDASHGVSKSALSKTSTEDSRPQKTAQAKYRSELDDFDSDEDLAPEPTGQAPFPEEPGPQQTPAAGTRSLEGGQSAQEGAGGVQAASSAPTVAPSQQHVGERLSESPVQVSSVNGGNPPPLVRDNSSQEEDRPSPRSTPSPELVEHEDADTSGRKDLATPATTRPASWDDASLRAFFDSGSEIRDLLVVVYDKSNVDPVGADHPVVGSLFREQNAKLAEITTQLDNMLGDWLARKQRLRGSV
ncbi:hypothetical protein VTK56DRAFT_8304 [Thermocarpiscus australiensis]